MAAAPIRLGVLGAARIADTAIVGPARATGHRLAAVAARDSVTTANGTRAEAPGRRSSYTYPLEAFADRLRHGAPLPALQEQADDF